MKLYWQKNNKYYLRINKKLKKIFNLSFKMRQMKNNKHRLIKKLMN